MLECLKSWCSFKQHRLPVWLHQNIVKTWICKFVGFYMCEMRMLKDGKATKELNQRFEKLKCGHKLLVVRQV